MSDPSYILFYVADPVASAAFYAKLLDKQPVELSPGFALFVLDSGVKLGFWAKHTVEPAATASSGCNELAFAVANNETVTARYNDWKQRGLPVAQELTGMDFGYTFVALDPDGHRLRVFAPSGS